MDNVNKQLQQLQMKLGLKAKEQATTMTEMYSDYEINLVPEVKTRMIKAMKFRNLMLFICIIVVAVAGTTVSILGSVVGGQSISISAQDEKLDEMSNLINKWNGLSELLTIQRQVNGINEANETKYVVSRIFSILAAILPEGPDSIEISDLSFDMTENSIDFSGQADAKVVPKIDYRVLESFMKGVKLMHYDYGRYVDAEGNEIPTRCIIEADNNGNTFIESKNKNSYIYAYWNKGSKDCDPTREDLPEEEEDEDDDQGGSGNPSSVLKDFMDLFGGLTVNPNDPAEKEKLKREAEEERRQSYDELMENITKKYDEAKDNDKDFVKSLYQKQFDDGVEIKNMAVEKIYRTPMFDEWYEKGNLETSGEISDIPHFNSECITYSGEDVNGKIYWTQENDCELAAEDVYINNSANGKNANEDLVLTFKARIVFDKNVFLFKNKHMMAISPNGRNVTDSYMQIEGMFAERAAECTDSDVVCTSSAARANDGEDDDE